MQNTNFQTIHQFGAGISQVVRQATGRDPVQNIEMEHVTVAQNKKGYPVQSFMGNPLTFTGEKQGYLGSVLLEMFVRRNLHGYGYPWPAGGGVNKWDEEWEPGRFNTSTGEPVNQTLAIRSKHMISVLPGEQYTPYWGKGYMWCFFYDDNNNLLTDITVVGSASQAQNAFLLVNNSPFTIPSGAYKFKFYLATYGDGPYDNDVSVNYPASYQGYYPYSNICPITSRTDVAVLIDRNGVRKVYTSDFPAPGVYAGTFNMATGELKITALAFKISDFTWVYAAANTRFSTTVQNLMQSATQRTVSVYSSHFQTISDGRPLSQVPMNAVYTTGTNNRIYITSDTITNPEEFVSLYGDAQLVYPLQDPIVMKVPKQDIPTIIGENIVATDADLLEVTLYYLEDI